MQRRPIHALALGAMLATMLAGCHGPQNVTAPKTENPAPPQIIDGGHLTPSSTTEDPTPDLNGDGTCVE